MTQEEKINVAKLLKNCPKNMELNCLMYEDVYFDYVDELNIIHCHILHTTYTSSLTFNQHGTPNSDIKSKCVIFPKGKTTWEGFVPPCKFKDGDIVTWKDGGGSLVACIYKERKNTTSFYHNIALYNGGIGIILDGEIVLTDDELCFATEEEKAKLFDAIKSHGYEWNTYTKTLEKLVKPKFKVGDVIQDIDGYKVRITEVNVEDEYYLYKSLNINWIGCISFNRQDNWELVPDKFAITTLKPFDKVLVRDNNEQFWTCDWFSFHDTKQVYPFACVGHYVSQCIPYEGNEHLLGTTDDCDEHFKNWE